jgi:hypothetical protein
MYLVYRSHSHARLPSFAVQREERRLRRRRPRHPGRGMHSILDIILLNVSTCIQHNVPLPLAGDCHLPRYRGDAAAVADLLPPGLPIHRVCPGSGQSAYCVFHICHSERKADAVTVVFEWDPGAVDHLTMRVLLTDQGCGGSQGREGARGASSAGS